MNEDFAWGVYTKEGVYVDSAHSREAAEHLVKAYQDPQYAWLLRKAFGPKVELEIRLVTDNKEDNE